MRKSLLCIAIAGGLIMGSSCVNLKKVQTYPPVSVEVADRYLVKQGNDLDVNMEIEIPSIYTHNHTGILVYPVMVGSNAQLELPPVVVDGRTYEQFNERQEELKPVYADKADVRFLYTDRGTVAQYHTSVDYMDWMKGSKMYADVYAGAYTKSVFLGRFPIEGGVLDLTKFIDFKAIDKYYYTDPLARRVVVGGVPDDTEKVTIFSVGSSQLHLDPKVGEVVRKHIESILADPEMNDYLISIEISNSPEGSLESNRRLGQSREKSLRGFLNSIGIPDSKINSTMFDEGWDELQRMLPGLGLSNLQEIQSIMATTADLDRREALIKQRYPADYQKMLGQAYPSLRYGKITVSTQYKGAPGKTYVYTFGDLWSGRVELNSFVVSDATPLDVYATNAQMLDAVKMGNIGEAERLADRIPNIILPEFIYSNKGMVMLKAGRTDEAKALLQRAPSIPEACYNAGVLQLLNEEYDRAANNLAPFNDMNSAVSALYAGRNTEAMEMLLLQPKSAERDYLLAMAYARLGKNEQALQLLSGAVAVSPALREKAANEPDFNPVNDKAGFGTITKQ